MSLNPRVVGSLLVVIGAAGFLTIADDLHHVGEILGVGSVLFIGLLLLFVSSPRSSSNRLAVWWLAGAVGVGAVVGAAIDDMPVGVGGGLTIGLVMAVVVGRSTSRAGLGVMGVHSRSVGAAPDPRVQRTRSSPSSPELAADVSPVRRPEATE